MIETPEALAAAAFEAGGPDRADDWHNLTKGARGALFCLIADSFKRCGRIAVTHEAAKLMRSARFTTAAQFKGYIRSLELRGFLMLCDHRGRVGVARRDSGTCVLFCDELSEAITAGYWQARADEASKTEAHTAPQNRLDAALAAAEELELLGPPS